MAYEKQTWVDRQVQYPNRYIDQNSNVLELRRSPGTITENGSLFSAERMNHIEDGVKELDNNMLFFSEEELLTTYKVLSNLLGNNTKINASEIAVKDGTDSIRILSEYLSGIGKSIVLCKNSAQNLTADTVTDIVWEEELYNDTNGKLTKSGNRVVVGSGINNILVNAKYQDTGPMQKYIYIRKKSTDRDEEAISTFTSTNSVLETNAVVNVCEGDEIYIQAYSKDADSATTSASRSWNVFAVIILN